MAGAAMMARTHPAATQAASRSAITPAAAAAIFSGRVIRFSSRCCAASQSADSRCRSGGAGRRGGGPGSACGVAYCHPR